MKPSQRKLVAYLVCALTGFSGLALVFPGYSLEVLLIVILGCIFVGGLIDGELSFGRGSAKRIYRRSESPLAYWCVAVFWFAIICGIILAAFFGERRGRNMNQSFDSSPSAVLNFSASGK